jgi:hypothetical protein
MDDYDLLCESFCFLSTVHSMYVDLLVLGP